MPSKWQLRRGSETLIVIPREDLFPQELAALSIHLHNVDFDHWLADPLSRRVLLNIYEAVNGRSSRDFSNANVIELQQSIKLRLSDAFRRKELIVVPLPRSQTRQKLEKEAEGAHPRNLIPAQREKRPKTWVEVRLLDDEGRPMPGARYRLELPNGEFREGFLDGGGRMRFTEIDPGECSLTFPDLDKDQWEKVS